MIKLHDKYQAKRQTWLNKFGDKFRQITQLDMSLTNKVKLLNALGIPTMTGKQFTKTNLFSLLKSLGE